MKLIEEIPKFKMQTTIAVPKELVLKFFEQYIIKETDKDIGNYICLDGSTLILHESSNEQVYVEFHAALVVNSEKKSISFSGKNWFLKFCIQIKSEIIDLNNSKKIVIPASDGALMSQIFTSKAYRIASHYRDHPKDKQVKGPK